MGKPYQKELEQMPGLYEWACVQKIDVLSKAVQRIQFCSLMAIGSGGSFTSAQVASSLHQTYFGRLAKPSTPLEVAYTPRLAGTAALFLTAEGKNQDILGAFRLVVQREPCHLIVLCGSIGSPLATIARKHHFVNVIEIGVPTGKDGFVATNSLLATVVLLIRAYAKASGVTLELPPTLAQLLDPQQPLEYTLDRLKQASLPTLRRQTLLVLHGPTCHAAAVDLESKCSEAALGTVQLADYRSFAHGRHHWLDKRNNTTGIIAFFTPQDEVLAERTLALIPHSTPITRVCVPHTDSVGSLSGLVCTLYLAGLLGQLRKVDPGQPRISGFGRQIYHMKINEIWTESYVGLGRVEGAAIRRKSGKDLSVLFHSGALEFWKTQVDTYVRRLTQTRFYSILCDYDGTLCEPGKRIEKQVAQHLQLLLDKGYLVGIATGRGKSVRDELRQAIDHQYWSRILVGFYNAAEIAPLDNDHYPDSVSPPCPALEPVQNAMEADRFWSRLGELTFRKWQITLKTFNPHDEFLLESARRLAQMTGTVMLQSTHSIDIVPFGVSKTNLLQRLAQDLNTQSRAGHILCIGDLGRAPGNDADLLASPFGLSVDEVSVDPRTCWNLAPPGHRGVQAVLDYLNAVLMRRDGFSLDIKKLGFRSGP